MIPGAEPSRAAPLEDEPRPLACCIGYPIWRMDPHRRVYKPRGPGEAYAHGGPIWREHWHLGRITNETTRMWIVDHAASKFPKTIVPGAQLPLGLAWTAEEVDRLAWGHDNAYPIAQAVQKLDVETLARIARLIGYEVLPPC